MIDTLHGMILDRSDLVDSQEQCPMYCQLIDNATAPCPLIVSNNPLFVYARMYKAVEFELMIYLNTPLI